MYFNKIDINIIRHTLYLMLSLIFKLELMKSYCIDYLSSYNDFIVVINSSLPILL